MPATSFLHEMYRLFYSGPSKMQGKNDARLGAQEEVLRGLKGISPNIS